MMQYDKYKNSGIEWLGQIPEHWQVKRVKDIFISLDYKRIPISGELRGKIKEGEFDYYGASGVIDKIDKYIFDDELILIGEDGANLLTRSKPLAFIAKGKFWVNNHAHILKPKKDGNLNFLVNALETLDYSMWVSGSAQPKLTQENLNNVEVYFPPLEEQKAITKYLDTKSQAIDKKINLLAKKTDYYIELRKSLINDAVCKGLEKKVKLKESEFAFSVNSNWKRFRLKDLGFLYSGLSGKAGDDFNQDDNPNNKGFIPFTNIANNTYLKANHLGTVVVYENEKQNNVRKGDLFFLMSSEGYDDVGKTAALAEDIPETYLNSFCKGYRITKKNCEPYFLNYLLLSDNYRKSLITEGKGFTRINLKMEKVTDFFVYLPPTKAEQTAIAAYLDEKTQMIDAIVANINTQIETLKELRKTLINDVVTGKIKVVK
jgi:type I restriction enzyme, S subunit